MKDGNALISVRVEDSDEIDRAKENFNDADAEHISVQDVV